MQHPVSFVEGRFVVIRLLGEGGMAFAYVCLDRHLRRAVAIKVPRPNLVDLKWVAGRFAQEVETQASATHPNVVTLHDAGIERSADGNPRPYIVMEYVGGVSLKDCFHPKRKGSFGALPPSLAARVTLAVLSSVTALHEVGIIHRDINPSNIMLGWKPGVVKLMDFGIARIVQDSLDGEDRQTKTSVVIYTEGYSAPEQRVSVKNADHRADVYAVGATLYAVLTGVEPDDLHNQKIDDPEFLLVPERFREVVFGATRYRPEARAYQTAADMAVTLEAAMGDLPREEEPFLHWLAARRDASEVEEAIRLALEKEKLPPEEQVADGYTRWYFADHAELPAELTSPPALPPVPVVAPKRGRYRVPGIILLSGAMIAAAVVGIGAWSKRDPSPSDEAANGGLPVETTTARASVPDDGLPTPGVGSQDSQHPVSVPAVPPPEDPPKPVAGGKRPIVQVRPAIAEPVAPPPIVPPPPVASVPDPAPATPTGRISLADGATSIVLVAADGTRHATGRVPPGTYRVEATFETKGVVKNAGSVSVLPDEAKAVSCNAAFSICR